MRLAKAAIHQGYDKAGLREALARGMELCIEVEGHPSDESRQFYKVVRSRGTAAAMAWLDERLNTQEITG